MQAIKILDIKPFMQLLFQSNQLDAYHLVSSTIQTDMVYTLDGHINLGFFDEDTIDSHQLSNSTYLPWSLAKEKIFLLIKGKRTPSQLKIVLKANPKETDALLHATNSSLNSNDVDGIFINILFQDNELNVICGISYKTFTLEKVLEEEFTANIITFFKHNGVACE